MSKRGIRPLLAGGLLLGAVTMPSLLLAQSQTRSYPVSLELLAPSSGGNRIPTVTLGGWPIVLRLTANHEIGIGAGFQSGLDFPINGDDGFVVFEEPDDCHAWVSNPFCDANETYVAFSPGVHCEDGLTGGSVPSLALLSDAGIGAGGLNLAGLFNVVGYELDDTSNHTNVIASLVAPNGFVTQSTVIDLCVGAELQPGGPCEGPILARVGTGPIVDIHQIHDLLNQNNVATLRAFVVNGRAPSSFSDLNGDGVIGARDAELAGIQLLSREVVFRVRTLHQTGALSTLPLADLDGNGIASCVNCEICFIFPGECAPGGGGLKPVPR